MSASVRSQSAEILLTEEIRCASIALATSLESSLLQTLVSSRRSRGTQCAYNSATVSAALRPFSFSSPPIKTRSGVVKSSIALPSAKNSGFETTENWVELFPDSRIRAIASAVRTGRVLFSTTITFGFRQLSKISRAVFSQNCKSAAFPAPSPNILVGVFTETKIISASVVASATSV